MPLAMPGVLSSVRITAFIGFWRAIGCASGAFVEVLSELIIRR
jgi:hypothetical protein